MRRDLWLQAFFFCGLQCSSQRAEGNPGICGPLQTGHQVEGTLQSRLPETVEQMPLKSDGLLCSLFMEVKRVGNIIQMNSLYI